MCAMYMNVVMCSISCGLVAYLLGSLVVAGTAGSNRRKGQGEGAADSMGDKHAVREVILT